MLEQLSGPNTLSLGWKARGAKRDISTTHSYPQRMVFLVVGEMKWRKQLLCKSQHELALTEVERKSVEQTVTLRFELTIQFTEGLVVSNGCRDQVSDV